MSQSHSSDNEKNGIGKKRPFIQDVSIEEPLTRKKFKLSSNHHLIYHQNQNQNQNLPQTMETRSGSEDISAYGQFNEEEFNFLSYILGIVENADSNGISLEEIYQTDDLKAKVPLSIIENALEILRDIPFRGSSLRLVYKVGYDHFRFVSGHKIERWTIQGLFASKTKSSTPIFPRLWIDMDGNSLRSIFDKCCQAVMGLIITKPGIYKSNLFSKLATSMSWCELSEILDYLHTIEAIEVYYMKRPHMSIDFFEENPDLNFTEGKKIKFFFFFFF